MTKTDLPFLPTTPAEAPEVRGSELRSTAWLGLSLSPELLRHFPKPCRPRKTHRCRLCDGKIEIGEPCCRWEYLEPGEGYGTSHAHPECYQHTLDAKWDEGDWECMAPGDIARPNTEVRQAPAGALSGPTG